MSKINTYLLSASLLALAPFAQPALAQNYASASDVVQVELLPGWREENGTHISGIRLILAEGWKTYWRAPGDGGLPTSLDWEHSDNIEHVQMRWPRPQVFDVAGMRSVGYENEITIPLELTPSEDGNISLNARLNFGICREVCVPAVVDLQQILTPDMYDMDSNIQSALDATPIPAAQLGIEPATCAVEVTANGTRLHIDVAAELAGADPAMIVEYPNQDVWVGTTKLKHTLAQWHGVTPIYDGRTEPRDLSFDDVRITLLTTDTALDIRGCNAS